MLQHISDESLFNMALDALSNGLKYSKNVFVSGLSKSNQGIYIYIYICGHSYLVLCVDLHVFLGKAVNICEWDERVRKGCVDPYEFTWRNLQVLQDSLSEI